MAGVSEFVDQVQDIDYINLFLTNVGSVSLSLTPSALFLIHVGEANSRKRRLLTYATPYVVNLKLKTSPSMSILF